MSKLLVLLSTNAQFMSDKFRTFTFTRTLLFTKT